MTKKSMILFIVMIAGLSVMFCGYVAKEYYDMKKMGFFKDWTQDDK